MCTVSYIPTTEGFVITSNRDEHIARQTSSPVSEQIGNTSVIFPKDKLAGGTWIAAGDNGRICCLLNGAFNSHERKKSYALSRGKVLLAAFEHQNITEFIETCELSEVEPFTLIIAESTSVNLTEFRWDGSKKHVQQLDTQDTFIWSSATLYDTATRQKRKQWFNDWKEGKKSFNKTDIFNFHSSTHGASSDSDVIMSRGNGLKTVSITQVEANKKQITMDYHDLLNSTNNSLTLSLKQLKNA